MKKILLKSLLDESMIRVNGGRLGAVETMKDNPPFANEEQWMVKHGLKEANINPKLVKQVNQFVKGISKYYNIPEKSARLTIKQIMMEAEKQ